MKVGNVSTSALGRNLVLLGCAVKEEIGCGDHTCHNSCL